MSFAADGEESQVNSSDMLRKIELVLPAQGWTETQMPWKEGHKPCLIVNGTKPSKQSHFE